jgi:hypothetical protein
MSASRLGMLVLALLPSASQADKQQGVTMCTIHSHTLTTTCVYKPRISTHEALPNWLKQPFLHSLNFPSLGI